jgi:Mrp family chromosome partitioning ATPase/capsular polysaccharide biosynthesis protein
MDSRLALERYSGNTALGAVQPVASAESFDFSNRFAPYKRVHRLLRGRYYLLIPAILVAMIAGGAYGWHKAKPIYRSEGIVQVNNQLPVVMQETDVNEPLNMFEEFVQSQVLLMSSRGIIAAAMDNPDFKQALGARHDLDIDGFEANLIVEQPPRTQVIDITYTDSNPVVATKAVQSLIDAFMQRSGKAGDTDIQRRMAVLQEKKASLTKQMNDMRAELAQMQPPSLLSIAMVDEMMRSLLERQSALASQLDGYIASGFGESRAEVRNARAQLQDVNAQIEAYQKEVAAMQAATAGTPSEDRHVPMLPRFLPPSEQIDALRAERDQVDQRINVLSTESSLGAERFRILSNGDTPTAPYTDRRPRVAASYGIAAGIVPLIFFSLIGLTNRRLRFSEDAVDPSSSAPLLGVLPELPAKSSYAELSRIAAYCVHNLRIRLELMAGRNKCPVYMVTSAVAGEGKTSLTLALGCSFASAGKRVLLVDTDLIGKGLSTRLKCSGKPGLLESVQGAGLGPVEFVMRNVAVLPVGIGGPLGASGSLLGERLNEIVEAARAKFDLIIMDTGPVVASLQTPIVAQAADHVIMTVSNGLQEALSRRSMQILRSVGIQVSGLVFNRARSKDYRRWVGGDMYYASSADSKWNSIEGTKPHFGPLAEPITEAELVGARNGRS